MSGYIGPQPVPQATQTREAFTATSGQTTFNTGGYTAGYIDVFLNGVKLAAADYQATNGSDVVLTTGAATGDILETVAYTAFTVADQDFTGTTTAEDLTVTGSFTSQGIDDNATSTAMTLDSSGNVGIGVTPTEALHVNGNIILNDGSFGSGDSHNLIIGDKNAYIQSTHGQPLNFGAYNGFVFGRATASNLTIATEQVRIDADGLKFNGDTAAANALSDYEEGTWSPTLDSTGTVGVGTYTTRLGRYCKIGDLVYFQAYLVWTNYTGTGNLQFKGLPFTPSAGTNQFASVHIGYCNGLTWGGNIPQMHVYPTTDRMPLGYATNNGTWTPTPVDTSGQIIFSGHYMTA